MRFLDLTSGESNTAIGFNALGDNTTGSKNTATGLHALVSTTPPAATTRPTVFQALEFNTHWQRSTRPPVLLRS